MSSFYLNKNLHLQQGVETREDEEQSVKLAEILELLLAAGYFRARIKGLSPFDKVVGGMTWCITTCNFDIDVDLLFQENSTIGQKIALTEKIVSVLPKMKCPHRLEPHQIQGLDFIHIYPVIQWLVKRAIETREEMGDYVRAYSISQFQKTHILPEDEEFLQRKDKAVKAVLDVLEVYKPQRRYRRQKEAGELMDEESRVHSTLLEYGSIFYSLVSHVSGLLTVCLCLLQVDGQKASLSSGCPAAPPGMSEVSEEDDLQAAEEVGTGKLTASAVGQIVGLQSEEIKQIASEYAGKQSELSSEERSERFGPLQQHRRAVASINKQIQDKTKQLEEVGTRWYWTVLVGTRQSRCFSSLNDVVFCLCGRFFSVLEKLRSLVTMNENLKQQEQEFRTHCREEMTRLQQNIEELKTASGQDTDEDKVRLNIMTNGFNYVHSRNELIDKQYNTDRDKLHKIRLLMARRNREIAILQRKIDEVPSRAELTQYQKRFIELYSQVSATHKETKQFFTLYNTLDDKKVYLEKEANLLNSIHDNFQQAMASSAAKEQFLRQMEQIVEGIKQNRIKMEKKKQENKMRRDQLNDEYLELLDKQRLYFKTVKDFKEECRKNEMLLSKLRAKGAS
uniref:Coiled-coil domain-containing protein 93 n=1 Tax=Sphaeramia orbicularis TaxID=375764 RepID=A0A672ZUV9_9TELE